MLLFACDKARLRHFFVSGLWFTNTGLYFYWCVCESKNNQDLFSSSVFRIFRFDWQLRKHDISFGVSFR